MSCRGLDMSEGGKVKAMEEGEVKAKARRGQGEVKGKRRRPTRESSLDFAWLLALTLP